jgi:uncharacterized membrane protein YfcA
MTAMATTNHAKRRPLRTRQWLPLAVLGAFVLGSGIGALMGNPNSWLWALGGVAVILTIAAIVSVRRRNVRS